MSQQFQFLLRSSTQVFVRHGDVLNRTSKEIKASSSIIAGPIVELRFGGRKEKAVPITYDGGDENEYFLLSSIQGASIKSKLKEITAGSPKRT